MVKRKQKLKVDLEREIRNIGIAFIVLGVLHFILSGFLEPTWGIVLIFFGVLAFFYRSRKMLLIFGLLLILVGVLNLLSSVYEVSIFWILFGVLQIYFGIQVINRYKKVKENPRYVVQRKNQKRKLSTWVWVIVILLIMFNIVTDFVVALFVLIIGFLVGYQNYDWAKKIKKNTDTAFTIGFAFGLLGLLGYWVYYLYVGKGKVSRKG